MRRSAERLAFSQQHQLPQRYILSVNRFVAQKNLSGLLRAFAHYVAQGQAGALNLVIAGDGPLLRNELIDLIDELGLQEVVSSDRQGGLCRSTDALCLCRGLCDYFEFARGNLGSDSE